MTKEGERERLLFMLSKFHANINSTMIHNQFQDFADRHYEYFGGRQHFSFLIKAAQKFSINRCDEIISTMKQFKKDLKTPDRIKYFTSVLYKTEKPPHGDLKYQKIN